MYTEHSIEKRRQIKANINDYIWSIISPFIRFVQVNDIENICENLTTCFPDRELNKFYYHTEASYSFPKKYIEIVHCCPTWRDYIANQECNMNNIGCLFSLKQTVVENTCVIIANKYDISKEKSVVIDSVTKDDILRVIRRRFYSSSVMITHDGLKKYYYQDPGMLIKKVFNLNDNNNVQNLSFSHLKYNLSYFFIQDKKSYVNEIATRINGSYRVYGDVLVIHEMEDKIYTNISIHEIKRINVLSYGRLYDRQLKLEESHEYKCNEMDENGKEKEVTKVPYWSRYIVAESRMAKWKLNKNKCINCNKEITNPVICEKCYRAKYCSNECMIEFRGYHNDECIEVKVIL